MESQALGMVGVVCAGGARQCLTGFCGASSRTLEQHRSPIRRKAAVLEAVEAIGWGTSREIAAWAGLTMGQKAVVLSRYGNGRFVERGVQVDLVPEGRAFCFRLAPRGTESLHWTRGQS